MLNDPISELWNIGDDYQARLEKLEIKKVKDLFFHFPYRYLDYSKITPINEIKPSNARFFGKNSLIQKQEDVYCVVGIVKTIKNIQSRHKKVYITKVLIEGARGGGWEKGKSGGAINIIWFNQPYLSQSIKPKTKIAIVGKVSFSQGAFISPDFEIITDNSKKELIHTCRIVPVYPVTRGLTSKWYRYLLKPLLDKYAADLTEYIPEAIRKKHNLLSINQAIKEIHFPRSIDLAEKARYRFCFEELFLIQLQILKTKKKSQKEKTFQIKFNLEKTKQFISSLPFQLTQDQKIVTWEILQDLEKKYPMNRLLQGDVGSGKTVVAAIAALNVIDNGYQVALMAPTEILAGQHFESIAKLLSGFNIKVGLLTSKNSKIFTLNQAVDLKKAELLKEVESQGIDLIIGTHSLIATSQKSKLKFKKLGLVILDEQHRFGVTQRSNLSKLSGGEIVPHNLSMTATPIPRTLTLTIYGNLNFSVIKELPKNRKIIITKNISDDKRKDAYDFIQTRISQGEQAFVICPRIEAKETNEGLVNYSSASDTKTVISEYEKLKTVFPNLKISMLHGKLKSKEKAEILQNFKENKSDILVSTSVVEVGIDIPNATIMMIEGAEMFGLAQLHQLRGRVGRSDKQSHCFLFTEKEYISPRLRVMEKTNNGFILAEKDLEIRGPGDFLGNRQWGIPDITMSALTDLALIEKAKQSAIEILKKSPDLDNYPELKSRLSNFQQKLHLE
ncbi:MAG: ATP-dependent DNA helicase RecG [Methanosarcinales archaeon]|nr:ATP-dependent DNA helicase RecG [Methanosarcinales archaeon]